MTHFGGHACLLGVSMKKLKRAVVLGAIVGVASILVGQNAAFANDYYAMPSSEFELNNPVEGDAIVEDWASYLDATANLYGWTDDAFDGWGDVTLSDGEGGTWTLDQSTHDSLTVGADGTTTIVFTGNTSDALLFASDYDVTATVTLQGSFAQWSVDVARSDEDPVDADLIVTIGGDLGSDSDSTFDVTGTSMVMVSNDTGIADPVMAWEATATGGTFDGWDVADGSGTVLASTTGSSSFAVTVAMVEWDPCSFDAAVAYAESIKSSLVENFGAALDPFNSCLTVEPLTLTYGVATTAMLTYSLPTFLTDPEGDYSYFGSGDPFEVQPVVVDIQGLPAGVTYTSSQDPATGVVTVQFAGSPTEGGTFTPQVTFAHLHTAEPLAPFRTFGFEPAVGGDYYDYPEFAAMTMTVTLPQTGINGAESTALLALSGGVIVAGAAAVFVVGARRRNALKMKA